MFVDEAYTLAPDGKDAGKDFGIKALETIMQVMTGDDPQRPVFIFAGYEKEMMTFLSANPGLARRIAYKFHFEDYAPEHLAQIARIQAGRRNLTLAPGVSDSLPRMFESSFTPAVRSLWNGGLAGAPSIPAVYP